MVGATISEARQSCSNLEPSAQISSPAADISLKNSTDLISKAGEECSNHVMSSSEQVRIPVIDMAVMELELEGPDGGDQKSSMREEMVRACEAWGFFQLINHGIDASLLARATEVSREFFKLPEEEKLKYKIGPGNGHGYHSRKLIATGENKLSKSIDHLYYPTSPPWIRNTDRWPRNPPNYIETITEYAGQLRPLAEKLMCILSESLVKGLKQTALQDRFAGTTGEPIQSMRTNYYPPTAANDTDHPNQPSDSAAADDLQQLDTHSDPGGLTLLLQNDVVGLEVKRNNQWVQVEPIPNAFVVNIGDQIEVTQALQDPGPWHDQQIKLRPSPPNIYVECNLRANVFWVCLSLPQMLSNGRYKSIEHRGLAHPTRERLSLATFYSPDYEAVIGPIQELVSDAHPAVYKNIKYHDYFSTFVKQGLNGKEYVRAATDVS